jgi:hypothetical protein
MHYREGAKASRQKRGLDLPAILYGTHASHARLPKSRRPGEGAVYQLIERGRADVLQNVGMTLASDSWGRLVYRFPSAGARRFSAANSQRPRVLRRILG